MDLRPDESGAPAVLALCFRSGDALFRDGDALILKGDALSVRAFFFCLIFFLLEAKGLLTVRIIFIFLYY